MRTAFRSLARWLAPSFSVEGARKIAEIADPFARLSWSQEGEDMILRRIFENQSVGFYVDVGAHHPFRFSNTCCFYRRGWHGINIDADPAAIEAFRRARPRDINLSVGVLDSPGKSTFHVFSDPALNTFDEELASQREKLTGYRVLEKRVVVTDRLDSILVRHLPQGSAIDILNVDAEGRDLEVLRSNDWRRFRPRCVLVEARIAGLDELGSDSTNIFLSEQGYRLYAKTVNTLIYVPRDEAAA
jgi:FkbM family methyltransferase